jgi:D-glycero-alpha-D-manno-heptose 1-phosphate guanylyltransferase
MNGADLFSSSSKTAAPESPLASISAVILAGGLGTRLRAVAPNTQKAAASVAGRPFAAYLLELLAAQGCRHVVMALGYKAAETAEALVPYAHALGLELDLSVEPAPLGTGGALRLATKQTRSDPVLVMNGDSCVAVDLVPALHRFREIGAAGLLTLARVDNAERYGRVECDAQGRIVAFREKGVSGDGAINAGVYFLARQLIDTLPADRPASLETDLLAVADGLWGWTTTGPFLDIGTPDAFAQAPAFVRAAFGPATLCLADDA